SFSTLCDVMSTFPWTENFESVSTPDLPLCWLAVDNNSDGDEWKTYTTYGVGGSIAAGLYTDFNSGANDDYLILPQFALTGNQRLKFSVRARSSGEPNDYEVLLSTTGYTPADFTTSLMPLTTVSSTTHTEITPIDLSAYTGNVYIAIHVPSGGLDGYYIYFDDFVLEDIPSCPSPMDLTASGLTSSSADLGWTDAGSANLWDVYVVPAGDPAPDASTTTTDVGVTTNPYTKSGLTDSTAYEFYVRTDCGGGDISIWVGPYPFQTLCVSTIVPYTLDFESVTTPNLPICGTLETLNGNDWETANVSGSGFSSNVLRYSWNSSQSADTWFYTQGLDLTGGTSYQLSFSYGNN